MGSRRARRRIATSAANAAAARTATHIAPAMVAGPQSAQWAPPMPGISTRHADDDEQHHERDDQGLLHDTTHATGGPCATSRRRANCHRPGRRATPMTCAEVSVVALDGRKLNRRTCSMVKPAASIASTVLRLA
jgi:hypothetical protein